jgi:hypothetical protein
MANPNPPPPPASHRFTSTNAAFYGARGAAERERRILQRVPTPKQRERARRELAAQRRQLRFVPRILHTCFGPPWRPRRRPPRTLIVTLLPVAVETLIRLMQEGTGYVRARATWALFDLALRPPNGHR